MSDASSLEVTPIQPPAGPRRRYVLLIHGPWTLSAVWVDKLRTVEDTAGHHVAWEGLAYDPQRRLRRVTLFPAHVGFVLVHRDWLLGLAKERSESAEAATSPPAEPAPKEAQRGYL